MREYRSQRGPFPKAVYFTQDEIETACDDALKLENLLPSAPAPVEIERFVEKRWGLDYRDLGVGILGCTVFSEKGVKQVLIAAELASQTDKVAERRLRSTIAHECGHALLHTSLFMNAFMDQNQPRFGDWSDQSAPKILCRESDIFNTKYDGRWWEVQANKTIGPFLMPKRLVFEALAPVMMAPGKLGVSTLPDSQRETTARQLADVFNVNPAVARIRLDTIIPSTGDQLWL
jgi:hypothetical protein